MTRPFNSELVIEEQISEATLRAYHVGYESNQFRLMPLVEVISRVIPEFALGYHENSHVPLPEMVDKLREAANTVYQTDKYQKRGEFGELILHLLLRDFCKTIPLISTIYFEDTSDVAAHGFDGVHITVEEDLKKLWLGESKLYSNGKAGVKELANDVSKHIKGDYLKNAFILIKRKIPYEIAERDYWIDLMNQHKNLDDVLDAIVLPRVCTYSSDTVNNHSSYTQQYIADFERECRELKRTFSDKCITTSVDILLMLLPVPSKDELVKELHGKLRNMQNI